MGSLLSSLTGGWIMYLVIGLAIAAAAAFGTHELDANHYNTILAQNDDAYTKNMKAVSDAAETAIAANLKQLQDWQTQTAADKTAADKELTDAKLTNDALALSLSTGARSLSVVGACNTGSGSSVSKAAAAGPAVHGATRCNIDASAAQRIVAITEEADKTAILLGQCQAYVRTVTGLPQPTAGSP